MGWTAARGEISIEGWSLFAILCFWQLPHFLAIAWMYRDQYARAGFVMLPVVDPTGERTGRQALIYTLGLLPVSLCPFLFKMAGPVYLAGALLLGGAYIWCAFMFSRQLTLVRARRLFLVSIIYLPSLLGLMVIETDDSTCKQHMQPAAHHEEPGFWRKYIFSTDHKVIGIQYGITGLLFLFFGLCLMMVMRWQLAYPGQPVPVIGKLLYRLLGEGMVSKAGVISPEFYNPRRDARHDHGVPGRRAAGGRRRSATSSCRCRSARPTWRFPKLNMVSYWVYFMRRRHHAGQLFHPGRRGQVRLDFLFAAGDIADMSQHPNGQTMWLIGMVFLITSSLLGSVNFITTIIQLRAKGLTWMRLPFFVWAQFVTSFLLLLAFPPLEAAGVLQLMDRLAGTSFFLPSGLVVIGHSRCTSAAAAARCSGSICSGSWRTRKCTC